MRGLINYGSYCSINSVVQCLRGTRELRDLVRGIGDDRDRWLPTKSTLAARLGHLILEMTEPDRGPCDPSLLLDSMSAHGLSLQVQEDSDFVFKCILDALITDDSSGPAKKMGQLWDIETEKRVRCLGCDSVVSTLDRSNTIPVFLHDSLPDELQDYVKRHSDNTPATCDYHCAICDKRTTGEITSKVLTLPPVVCVSLARVKNIGREAARIVKTEKRFAFPETLDLKYIAKEATANLDSSLYELYAVVAHRGTHYCGHYTAYVREDDSWYLADDTHIRLCSWDDVKATYEAGSNLLYDEVAYMLMYRSKNICLLNHLCQESPVVQM